MVILFIFTKMENYSKQVVGGNISTFAAFWFSGFVHFSLSFCHVMPVSWPQGKHLVAIWMSCCMDFFFFLPCSAFCIRTSAFPNQHCGSSGRAGRALVIFFNFVVMFLEWNNIFLSEVVQFYQHMGIIECHPSFCVASLWDGGICRTNKSFCVSALDL